MRPARVSPPISRCYRAPMTLRAALALAAALGVPAAARAENSASGHFETPRIDVPIADAYAFRADASMTAGRSVFVAVSNSELAEDAIDAYLDRRHMLDAFFADAGTKVVYLEFSEEGRWRGYSYVFRDGDGCGFCGGGPVTSTVNVKRGRIAGNVTRRRAEGRTFDVAFDVPIAPDDHGEPQGPGGGEPGRAWLAYHAAAEAGDEAKLRELVTSAQRARWKEAEKKGDGAGFLRYLTAGRLATATVRDAWVKGDRAVVAVSGESPSAGAMHGEAHLLREGGRWRVAHETLRAGAD